MRDGRLDWASQIIDVFKRHSDVRDARLEGSLVQGTGDPFSDIDIAVDVSGSDNGQFALEIPGLLEPHFPITFSDWAPSLLPDKYVQTFFLEELPALWHVDVSSVATPHVHSITEVPLNRADHFLKLWVLHAKKCLRKSPDAEQRVVAFALRVLDSPTAQPTNTRALMAATLDTISEMAGGSRSRFVLKCYEIYGDIDGRQ